jgi:hypothetical protein
MKTKAQWAGSSRAKRWAQPGRSQVAGRCASWLFAAAFLVALALLATACGGKHDPFVGTWNAKDSGMRVIVAKPAGQYVVTFVPLGTWGHAERDGDVLHVWAGAKPQVGKEMFLTHQPGSGEFLLTDPAGPGVHILFHRVGDSTATPSMSPNPWSTAAP